MTDTQPIPQFKSLDAEARFWDTHDTTDFEGEFQPVSVRFSGLIQRGFTIRLQTDDLHHLQHLARQKGVGVSSLVRMWVKERLAQQNQRLV